MDIDHRTWQSPGDATREGMAAKFRFLQAAGLSDREICRELDLVTRYIVTLTIKPKTQMPAFPERAWHFLWPSDGDAIGRVQTQGQHLGDEIQYRLIGQVPSALVEVDPRSGVLCLSDAITFVDTSNLMWKGTVEASDSFGQKSTATVWITPPGGFPSLGLSGGEIAWPRDPFQKFAGMANDRIQTMLAMADTWRTDISQFSTPSPALAEKPSPGNSSTPPELSQTLHQDSNPLSQAELPVEVAGVANELRPEQSAEPKAGADWASWVLDILKVALAIFAFVYYRKRTTRERNNSPSETIDGVGEGRNKNHSEQAPVESVADWIDEPEFQQEYELDSHESVEDEVDFGGETGPESSENFTPFSAPADDRSDEDQRFPTSAGHSVPAPPSTDVPDQYARLSVDFEHAGSSDPLVPSFSSPETLSPAAEQVEESAEREASIAQLLATEEAVPSETMPDVISAPSQNELDTLLTMLDQKYSILRPPGAEPVSPPEPDEVKTQRPVCAIETGNGIVGFDLGLHEQPLGQVFQ